MIKIFGYFVLALFHFTNDTYALIASIIEVIGAHLVAQLFATPRYMPEGRRFDYCFCHCYSSLT